MKDFWNKSEGTCTADKKSRKKSGREGDEALILPLVVLLAGDEKNTELIMALLYILS